VTLVIFIHATYPFISKVNTFVDINAHIYCRITFGRKANNGITESKANPLRAILYPSRGAGAESNQHIR
jgi:hypothetical protein